MIAMGQTLTDNQLLHRQYLESPVWQAKRQKALTFYGPVCSRCKEYGNDVHHKTYERVGGAELMEDLEVLCRDCHQTHHRVERATNSKQASLKRKSIDRRAIVEYLTLVQKQKLMDDFGLSNLNDLKCRIFYSDQNRLIITAAKMLGFTDFHGRGRKDRTLPSTWKEQGLDANQDWMSFEDFKTNFTARSSTI